MSSGNRVEFRDNALFRGIDPAQLAQMGLNAEPAVFVTGEIIFDEGSAGDCCYLVESGRVRISKAAPDGAQETLAYIGPGEFFGELALFYAAPRAARATAAAPTRAGKLSRSAFERVRQFAPLQLTTTIADVGIQHLREIHTHLLKHLACSDQFRETGIGLGRIAHDIRSPLATIKNAAELIADLVADGAASPEIVLKYADMIKRTATSALRITDQLLADIRGEATPAVQVTAPIVDVMQEATDQIVGLLQKKGVHFTTVYDYRGPITCHRTDLVRAVANLLRNALEALPPEGGEVGLRVEREADTVVVSVSDTGVGIPEDLQGWIFERRFTFGKSGGTGLGLEQVRRVVERHGGRIDLESEVGRGTTFWLRIPAGIGVAGGGRHEHAGEAADSAASARVSEYRRGPL